MRRRISLCKSLPGNGLVNRRPLTTYSPPHHSILRRTAHVVAGLYATLALIPIGFTGMAAYHWLKGHPKQKVNAFLFFAWTGFLSLPASMVLLASVPFVFMFDYKERVFLDMVQRVWAQTTCLPFFIPTILGYEHLASIEGKAVVLVSNHQSWADIYALFWLPLPFRFVAKKEIFYIPLVGWCMGLIGHIGVSRNSISSRSSVVETCIDEVKQGVSVFFFPEGTRSRDGTLGAFKKGAFVIALEADVPILPISISGTGHLMPPGETCLDIDSSNVVIKVHAPIYPENFESLDAIREYTRKVIQS